MGNRKGRKRNKVEKKNEGCSGDFEINRMHQWLGENFIALGGDLSAGGDSCQYAVLDTVAKTLVYKRLSKGLEWIEKCDDVKGWEKSVYCLLFDKVSYNAYLIVDESVKDTMSQNEFGWDKYTSFLFMGCFLKMGGCISEIKSGKINCFLYFDSRKMIFKNIDGKLIQY